MTFPTKYLILSLSSIERIVNMKFTLAQINFVVGDLAGNVAKIKDVLDQNKESEWIVFSELCVPGYYPMDLVNVEGFIKAQNDVVNELCQYLQHDERKVVLGVVTENTHPGKKWHNSMIVIQNGLIRMTYDKQLLPTYDVFDEFRHFEPGRPCAPVWREAGKPAIGFMICEDGWNDHGKDYRANPTSALDDAGAEIVISINASPSAQKKPSVRERIMRDTVTRYGWQLVYVNQVGGNDALVFDGNSFVMNSDGSFAYHAAAWKPEVQTVEYDLVKQTFKQNTVVAPVEGPEEWHSQLVLGIRDYFRKCGRGFKTALVGSSGGIDSAVVLALAADALGSENVVAITMPSKFSSAGSVGDSVQLCKNLGVTLHEVPIQSAVDALQVTFPQTSLGVAWRGVALENAQARMRGLILMGWANQMGGLVLSTGNKSEMSVGYATLYGDMNGALNPLGDLYKLEVYELARWINTKAGYARIPAEIIEKAPSAELAPDQKDEDSLPPYWLLDSILKLEIEGPTLESDEKDKLVEVVSQYPEERKHVLNLLDAAEFKRRQAPPIIRVHTRAFGAGWQFPVAQQYKRSEHV